MAQQANITQLIAPQQITNAAVAYYTTPSNQGARITKATATNTDAVARYIAVWVGTAADNAHLLCPRLTIPPTSRGVDIFELMGHVLAAGDKIWFQADANAVMTVMVSGVVLT